jgi:hypothetical protein
MYLALVEFVENTLDVVPLEADVRPPPTRRRIINKPLPLGNFTRESKTNRNNLAAQSKKLACILGRHGDSRREKPATKADDIDRLARRAEDRRVRIGIS